MAERSSDLSRLLIALRPGMHKQDVPFLASLSAQSGGTRYEVAAQCIIDFGPDDRIARISFIRDFPSNLSACDLHVGMPFEEALALYPGITLCHSNTLSSGIVIDEMEGGVTADGLEIALRRRDGKVGAFDLMSSSGAAAIRDRRAEYERRDAEARERSRRMERWKTISDPDEMLDAWAAGLAQYDGGQVWTRYAAWLKATAPIERHQAGCAWNWDLGIAPLKWIACQPDTDLATVTQIFFWAEPGYYAKYDWDREQLDVLDRGPFDLLMDIADRVRRGFYTRSAIALDGQRQFAQYFLGGGSPQFAIFDRDLSGKHVLYSGFADGLPEVIWRDQ